MSFQQQYMNEIPVDDEYELFVRAWTAYHETAHRIDGHIPPGHPDQGRLGHLAVRAGKEAMAKHIHPSVIQDAMRNNDWRTYHKWQHAKLEALRRLKL